MTELTLGELNHEREAFEKWLLKEHPEIEIKKLDWWELSGNYRSRILRLLFGVWIGSKQHVNCVEGK